MKIRSQILEHKIVAIIRGADPKLVQDIVEALYRGGIRIVEVTLNSENAFQVIKDLSISMGTKMLIGAGTVLDLKSAKKSINQGAQFIISPSFNAELVGYTRKKGILSIPGAFTATEIVSAYNAGADIIKIFPALNPQYIRDLRAPLSHIPMMPTGGINFENIGAFQKAGAVAFGIGSSLVNSNQPMDDKALIEIIRRSKQFVDAVSQFPSHM
jgi:2-dehydro-3-deoxyphosphogluconate aldolase / (4S)-4-hydroxy-2-oxoglutarate aldolase